MKLKDIVAISGLSGLHEIVAKREDGLIVRPLDEEKPRFLSNRIHNFTPLDAITIYTKEDTVDLRKVLQQMKENPPGELKQDNNVLKDYFKKVLPEYDEERVYVSDIKKIVKWHQQLQKHDLLKDEVLKEQEKENENAEEKKEPAKKTKPKAAAAEKENVMTAETEMENTAAEKKTKPRKKTSEATSEKKTKKKEE